MKRTLCILLSILLTLTGLACLGSFAGAAKAGDIIFFGNYPQTKVIETTALKNAANAATWKSYSYYIGTGSYDGDMASSDFMKYADFSLNGVKYRAVKFTKYRPSNTSKTSAAGNSRQDDNGYSPNTTYYFKYEPIEWRVLNPSAGLVLCETIIDAQVFQNVVRESASSYYYIGSSTTYANNYAESSIRTWLNNDFYNTAFNTAQKNKIKSTTIDNDAHSDEYSQYSAVSTNDPIFLLSAIEVLTTSFNLTNSDARKAKGTDYAKCQGLLYVNIDDNYEPINGFASWWLRSPDKNSGCADGVGDDGYVIYSGVFNLGGVRPVCCLSDLTSDTSQLEDYTVTATANPTAGGTVTGGGKYTDGQTATLTATANSGYIFSGWYKDGSKVCSNKSFSFTVTEDVTYTAKFSKLTMSHIVTVSADPAEGGTVSGGGTYSDGETATLNATPNSGYLFSGWYKDGTKVWSNKSFSFKVKENVTYTAEFSKLSMGFAVNAAADPPEGGTVSGDGAYSDGQTAMLSATPNSGYHFIGWYNGSSVVSSKASFGFTVTESVNLTAKFEKDADAPYTVTVSADPAEGGTVSGGGAFSEGQATDITATPKSGWHFTGWYKDGAKITTKAAYSFTVNESVTLIAKFEKDTAQQPKVVIRKFTQSTEKYDYRTTITFHADVENALPGGEIRWYVDDKPVGSGSDYTAKEIKNSFKMQAKYFVGNTEYPDAASGVETVNINTGFFAKIVAFFRSLFNKLPVITQ